MELLGAWGKKTRSTHRRKTFARPARKPTRGESSLSRQAALASGWRPLIAIESGVVKKEDIGRRYTAEVQIITEGFCAKELNDGKQMIPVC